MKRLTCPSLLVLTIVGATGAACTGGERNVTGDCPADEACSPLTPDGMHFTGVELVGLPLLAQPKITAVGGTQRIELWKVTETDDIVPLDLPFHAMTDNGDALSVAAEGTNSTVVAGEATGKDLLRITEADSDLLYDRYEIEAQVLDHVELVPSTSETYAAGEPIGFYAGAVRFGLALYSASGDRLADDSLTLTVAGPQPSRPAWDEFSFADLGPGTLTATLVAGGDSGPIDVDVVDAIDQVLPLSDTFNPTIHVGDQGEVCFHGAVDAGPGSVIGLPWNLLEGGPVTRLISLSNNCIMLQVNAAGTFTVDAEALGVTTQIQLVAVAASAKPSGAKPSALTDRLLEAYRASRGERAAMIAR